MNTEQFKVPEYKLENSSIYSLHTIPGKNIECNQFSFFIQPDYAGGLTEDDAKNEAKRLYEIITKHPFLLEEVERLQARVKELEDDAIIDMAFNPLKEEVERLKVQNEMLKARVRELETAINPDTCPSKVLQEKTKSVS